MTLIQGQLYKKKDFGIKFPANIKSDHIVEGELYSFFNMNNNNNKDIDGFIYEVNEGYQLIPSDGKTDLRLIFLYVISIRKTLNIWVKVLVRKIF
jgi:gamma-glutamylcyclotransferase (GGCT)/AIG2-like uncharacterized protein YtfP